MDGVRNLETKCLDRAFVIVGGVCALSACLLFGKKCVKLVESREL